MARKVKIQEDEGQKLRRALLFRRQALRQALAGDVGLLEELSSQNAVDASLLSSAQHNSAHLVAVETRELERVEEAIKRMDNGTYGICESCKKKIPQARLEALPYAALCIECQRIEEKHEAA